jgi:hypothetical protein
MINKTLIYPIIFFSLLLFCSCAYADAFLVKISLTEGEKSKDSWTSETNINIDGSQFTYTKTYSGGRKQNSDVSKTCVLTDDQVANIQSLLKDKNLLVSDKLIDDETKYKSFERFVNLSMTIAFAEKLAKFNVNGDVANLKDKDLYKNCYELINLIEGFVDKCN